MKINFILPAIGHSGGIDVINRYADILANEGHDVVIYKGVIAPNMHRYSSEMKNVVHQLYCTCKALIEKKSNRKNIKYIMSVSDCCVREADATIATSWPTAYQVTKLDKKCGKKWYFIQGFEIWDNKELGLKSYRLPLNKIVISTWINNQLYENLSIGPFPVVYNGLDTSLFKPRKDVITERDKLRMTVLMLNHDNPIKGVDDGLKVIKKIRHLYPSIRVVMFGLRDNTNLPDYIEYYRNPDRKTLVDLYQQSDIFLFPSHSDGWGLTPIEAMACGCAVVGTNTGFVLDLGKHGENMMICEPGDIEQMCDNIIYLFNNPLKLKSIGESGYDTVKSISWEQSARKLISILQN